MTNWLQVFIGGMVGAILRFTVQTLTSTSIMLWVVNILGSFILGSLNGYFEKKESTYKLFFTTGLLGAFTTFSTFSQNWFLFLRDNVIFGIVYGIAMTAVSFIAAFIGYFLNRGKSLWNG
ncbi:CrcB family protein [Lysinibacillus telephonicus]|nr:CrcB family protein [Lysinibacillus telephonicus]